MSDEYVLTGYFRFIQSETPGVIGKVVSIYKSGFAENSCVPIYRKIGETKKDLDV